MTITLCIILYFIIGFIITSILYIFDIFDIKQDNAIMITVFLTYPIILIIMILDFLFESWKTALDEILKLVKNRNK